MARSTFQFTTRRGRRSAGIARLRRIAASVLCTALLALTTTAFIQATADGDLDLTFGTGGRVSTANWSVARSVAIDASNRIVVAGMTETPARDFAVWRYNVDGTLDASFGTGGLVTTDFNANTDEITAVAIDRNGRIVAGGVTEFEVCSTPDVPDCFPNLSVFKFALARYNADGTLDVSFGPDGTGKVIADGPGVTDTAMSMALDPDGKIVLGGYSITQEPPLVTMDAVRFNEDGTLDTGFGTGGIAATSVGAGAAAFGVAVQNDRKVVLTGFSANSTDRDVALVRYNVDGTLDSTFGSSGVANGSFGDWETGVAVAVDRNGKIVVAGLKTTDGAESPADILVARYNTDGTLDTSFSGDGWTTSDFGPGDVAYALRFDALGKIVVAGQTAGDGGHDFLVARYKSDGSLDAGFGSNGHVTTDFNAQSEVAFGVAIDSLGRIVAAGTINNDLGTALSRYIVTTPPPADCMVSVGSDKPNTVNQGDLISYTITTANLGPNQAKNVVVVDTLAGGTTFVSAQANKGNVSGPPVGQTGTVTWNLGDITSGSTNQARLTITVQVRGKTSVTNTAAVSSDSPDPEPSNNSVSITTKVGAGKGNR